MRRLRSNELDGIATDAFRFRLPRRWSFQRLGPDADDLSGLEICDPVGRSTGLRCRVQLTGTNETGARNALALSLPGQRLVYYAALDPPLLMVRYRACTGRFYARWAMRQDSPSVSEGAESVFTWSAADRWDARSPDRVERDLRLMRQLSSPGFSWPMRFRVEIEDDALPGCARADVASAIRKRLSGVSRYVAICEDGLEAQGSVTLSPSTVHAAIGGFSQVTVRSGGTDGAGLSAVLAHLPLLIALALTRAGQVETAAHVCELGRSRRRSGLLH